tara:strand:+ start:1765 stop:2550 length:786 start_codon:yes stop_codon:yes gene_type:complete
MGTLAGKSPATTYKSLLKVANETNGITTAVSAIEDGEGTESCVSISSRKLQVTPAAGNLANTFEVNNMAGSTLFKVDTQNTGVKAGSAQNFVNSQILTFQAQGLVPSAGSHYFIPINSATYTAHNPEVANGTGTDPATTYDGGSSTDDILNALFFVPTNIVIDSVRSYISTTGTNAATINVHFNSFNFSNAGDSNDGNLSGGEVIASGSATTVTNAVIRSVNCSISGTSAVSEGKVLACFVENVTNTDPITLTTQVLYHFA